MQLDHASREELQKWELDLAGQYRDIQDAGLRLDLTRGKPSSDQLRLSNALDGLLAGDYVAPGGIDTRNYGGLDGLPDLKALYAPILGVTPEETLIGGASSLTLMHQFMTFAHFFGLKKPEDAWSRQGETKFICLVPGYDRHFTICQHLGISMIPAPLGANGPDMDAVERLVATDRAIKGMWCVPRFSNPTGHVYDDATVERIAALGTIAAPGFVVMWDNAYALHSLADDAPELASLMEACRRHGTENSMVTFGSTAKITFAGAGIAYMGASRENLAAFRKHLACATIGPDKVNQLRHLKLLPDLAALKTHMRKHAELLKPRFDIVTGHLREGLAGSGMGDWTEPLGGYFISFNTLPGLAAKVVELAAQAGVQLTPAGATWPYGRDPEDKNIRIAPSFPSLEDIDRAMQVFVLCVRLASVRRKPAL
jgi:aspartate/methionine/tyrosine aminotransferase